MQGFSGAAMVKWGWETFKKRPWFFILVFLLLGILSGNYSYRTSGDMVRFTPELVALFVLLAVIGAIISTLVAMGKTNLLLKAHESAEAVSWWDLWRPYPFWKFFLTRLSYGLIVVAGLILLVVPGIVWSIKYGFAPYLVIDRGMGVREALRESARMTDGHKWDLLWFGLLLIGVNILGLLCLLVGLLVSVPVTALACVHAYRTLSRAA